MLGHDFPSNGAGLILFTANHRSGNRSIIHSSGTRRMT